MCPLGPRRIGVAPSAGYHRPMGEVRVVQADVYRFRFKLAKAFRIALGATDEKEEIIVCLRKQYGPSRRWPTSTCSSLSSRWQQPT